MDDTENTESQTNETNESQTDDTSSNSEPSFSSDALSNGNSGPGFDIDWSDWENDTKTNDNDTSDNDTSDENRKAAEAWVDMHQHTDWGSGLTVDDVFNNDNVDNGYNTDDNSTTDSTTDTTTETNNQSRTEEQGDYATSSKENSNVQTTTVGKQDEITTTPDTITENKGIISNSNIQSVEGLDFQQKDKDDLESRKDRDKAEAEDKSDQLKNELRADAEKNAANKDGKGFQVGNKDKKEQELEDIVNTAKQNRENLENEINEIQNKFNKQKEDLDNLAGTNFDFDKVQKETLDKLNNALEKVKNLEDIANKELEEYRNKHNTDTIPENPAPTTPEEKPAVPEEKPEVVEDTKIVPEELPPEGKEKELEDNANAAKQKRENLENEINEANKQKEDLDKQREDLDKQRAEKKDIQAASDKNREEANVILRSIVIESGANTKKAGSFVPTGLGDIDANLTNEQVEEIISNSSKVLGKFAEMYADALRDAHEKNQILQAAKEEYSKADAAVKEVDRQIEENSKRLNDLNKNLEKARKDEEAANKGLKDYRNEHNTDVIPEKPAVPEEKPAVPEEKPAVPEEKTEKSEANLVADNLRNGAKNIRNNIANGKYKTEKEIKQAEKEAEKAEKRADALDDLDNSEKKVNSAIQPILENTDKDGKVDWSKCTPEQIKTYVDAVEEYNNNLKEANRLSSSKTNYDRTYTSMVAKANDFTLPNGQKYSDFAIDAATNSPAITKGLHEAKANDYKQKAIDAANNNNKFSAWWNNTMSKLENLRANMSQSFIGSKLDLTDNKVREQFHQMAKTNMKATYAAYNNVLNNQDKYAPEYVDAARGQIAQANALMTASAALRASTGAFSGLGDSLKDGKYGTTNPEALNAYQQTLNAVGNFSKITFGLGVLPGANEAYQNMYYMAGDKAKNSPLLNTDFDKDGFTFFQEYGNNAAVGMIAGAGQLSVGVALIFASPLAIGALSNPVVSNFLPVITKGLPINSITELGVKMITDGITTFGNSLWGVKGEVDKSIKLNDQITSYLEDAKNIVSASNNQKAIDTIDNAIKEITTKTEDFKINSSEINNFDNWLEGSGSNTADNGKFNQKLSYEDWLKLIQADPAMQEYAKKLAAEKNKNAQEGNADTRVNS